VKFNFWIGLLAATTLIFGAAYTLWMVKRVYFGDGGQRPRRRSPTSTPRIPDAGRAGRGRAVDGPVPKPFTDVMHVSVTELLKHVAVSKLN
jgi:NADH-quinone oxidoreductase subunit M